jgi:hypothetical protein
VSAGADYNLQILWGLARYIEENQGAEALREVVRPASRGRVVSIRMLSA